MGNNLQYMYLLCPVPEFLMRATCSTQTAGGANKYTTLLKHVECIMGTYFYHPLTFLGDGLQFFFRLAFPFPCLPWLTFDILYLYSSPCDKTAKYKVHTYSNQSRSITALFFQGRACQGNYLKPIYFSSHTKTFCFQVTGYPDIYI